MNEKLASLSDRYWDALMEAVPTWATILGDHRFDDRVEDPSLDAENSLIERLDGLVAEAEAIPVAGLDSDDRITRAVLLSEAGDQAEALRSRDAEYAVDPQMGTHISMIQMVPQMQAATQEHAHAFVVKASRTQSLFDSAAERLRQGVANGRTPPRVAAEKVLAQIDVYLAGSVESDPWLQVGPSQDMTEDEIGAFRDAMAQRVIEDVRPAVARYRDCIRNEVLPASRPPERSGICWLPDGEQVYASAIKKYTSLDFTAAEIHQIGLDEISQLGDEYRAMGATVLGTDDLDEIFDRLRNDTELRFETAQQVQELAERAVARALEASPDWFGRLPEAPCLVAPIPDVGAEDAPLAYYLPPAEDGSRPGLFFINLTAPETRTRYEAESLAFHEGVPGHHTQLAIAQELEGVPAFRRNGLVTAYVEGWGLYTERLADEMGLYSGDVERMGMLSFDSWRAGRLVVDTGIHALGWSRQQAIDFLAANSPQALNNIENEVDRYIGWPGQALAYKMGQRAIFQARRKAESTMGPAFDIKGFHDTVLESGPVPLGLMADLVDEWAASTG